MIKTLVSLFVISLIVLAVMGIRHIVYAPSNVPVAVVKTIPAPTQTAQVIPSDSGGVGIGIVVK
jgi:hypothetical protein